MFKRLILEDSAALFTLAAFITTASIFLSVSWRAFRMSRTLREKFEGLPFETPTPAAGGERPTLNAERQSLNVPRCRRRPVLRP